MYSNGTFAVLYLRKLTAEDGFKDKPKRREKFYLNDFNFYSFVQNLGIKCTLGSNLLLLSSWKLIEKFYKDKITLIILER